MAAQVRLLSPVICCQINISWHPTCHLNRDQVAAVQGAGLLSHACCSSAPDWCNMLTISNHLAGFPWRVLARILNNLLHQADHRVCSLDMHLSCCPVLTDSPARPLVLASSPPPVPAPAAAAAAAARVAAACVSVRPRTFSKRRLLLASAVLKPVAGLLVLLASETAPAAAAAVGLTDAGTPSLQSMRCSVTSRVTA